MKRTTLILLLSGSAALTGCHSRWSHGEQGDDHGPLNHLGQPCRKYAADYQHALAHDARAINTGSTHIRSIVTPELRVRYWWRLTPPQD